MTSDFRNRHVSTIQVYQWFERHGHLREDLQVIVIETCELAKKMVNHLQDGPELTIGLQKLLEAKDAFVRQAVLDEEKSE